MRILFAGSPDIALPALNAVAAVATELAVMSQPDKPVGRKKILTPTPVSSWALDNNVTLFRPRNHDEIHSAVSSFSPDLGITVAYGRILTPPVLALPASGWWNLHFSLLPRWRGPAPVQNALLAGDTTTGVTVFRLDDGVDTGPILAQASHPIPDGITAGELLAELSLQGAALLTDVLVKLMGDGVVETPQVGEGTHAPKLDRESARITATDTVDRARRRFQATTPEPGCFVTLGDKDQPLRILAATARTDAESHGMGSIQNVSGGVGIALSGGFLMLEEVQPAGKKAMVAGDWWRGVHGNIVIDG